MTSQVISIISNDEPFLPPLQASKTKFYWESFSYNVVFRWLSSLQFLVFIVTWLACSLVPIFFLSRTFNCESRWNVKMSHLDHLTSPYPITVRWWPQTTTFSFNYNIIALSIYSVNSATKKRIFPDQLRNERVTSREEPSQVGDTKQPLWKHAHAHMAIKTRINDNVK